MANLALKFGSYSFPSTFYLTQDPEPASVPMTHIPRSNGSRASTRCLTGKTIHIEGGFARDLGSTDAAAIRDATSTLRKNLQGMANLYTHDDRYWRNCQMQECDATYDHAMKRYTRIGLQFATDDPYQYSTATTSASGAISASGQTLAIANGGDAPAAPSVSLTVGGSGAKTLGATITNSTTGKAFTLAGACTGGDVIIVDCLNKTVTIGGVDKTALFDGLFWELATGANTITVAYTSATITNIAASFNARYF